MPQRQANSLTMTILFVVTMLSLMTGLLFLLIPESVLAEGVLILGLLIAATLFGVFANAGISQREKANHQQPYGADLRHADQDLAYYTIGSDGELIPLDKDEIEGYDEKLKNS